MTQPPDHEPQQASGPEPRSTQSNRPTRIDRYALLDLISVHTPTEQFEGYRQFPTELWRGHD
ncbi:MAG TPA: hypothetical protein VGP37_01080, partial [Candidatus Nanopelagicales bacterium]|nr:hypothetical protein [Candidatus Nanopelagicales bacterium]